MRKIVVIFFLCTSSFFLTACWDRYELEERANILGMAIDIVEKDSEEVLLPEVTHENGNFPGKNDEQVYKVTVQLAVPGKIKLGPEKGGTESEKTAWVVETYGYTMKDAMAILQQQLAEKLYYGHLQIIVVNQKILKEGVTEINDFLKREYEVRRTAWMIVSEGEASEVIEAAPPVEIVPSLYLSNTLDNSVKFGKIPREYLGKFWVDLSDYGADGQLPLVKVINKDRILINGLAYFKGNKMVGAMTPIQTGMYLAIRERNPGGYSAAVATNDGATYLIKSLERKSNIKVEVKNGKPSAHIKVEIDGAIEEEIGADDLSEKKLYEIEEKANSWANVAFANFLRQLQKDQSDIIAIGARIRAKYPKYWDEEVKTDEKWLAIYKDMDIQIKVNFKIERSGMEWR